MSRYTPPASISSETGKATTTAEKQLVSDKEGSVGLHHCNQATRGPYQDMVHEVVGRKSLPRPPPLARAAQGLKEWLHAHIDASYATDQIEPTSANRHYLARSPTLEH
jgi:hypothetical protein